MRGSKSTIAVIPARGGSKRLPGKNLMELGGIPLIAHSISYAKSNALVDAVYVSTDDPAIKEVALQYGAKVINRPAEISGDDEPTISAMQHVLETVDAENIVLLQPTNPLRPVNLLQEAFDIFTGGNYDSLFTVSRNHHKLGKITDKRFSPFNYEIGMRSQDLEPLYFENGLLYLSKASLIKQGKIISESAYPMITEHIFGTVDIDTKDDFEYAEWLLKKHHER